MSRYFLNWTSGAGGDFLLSLLHLIKPFDSITGVAVEPRINKWGVDTLDRLRPFEIADLSQHQSMLDATQENEVFHYHQCNENTLNFNDIIAVNVSPVDVLTTVFVGTLYNIKCRSAENIKRVAVVNQNAFVIGAHNFDYNTLVVQSKLTEVERFLRVFDREHGNVLLVQHLIQKYHQYNCSLLDRYITDEPEQFTRINSLSEMADILQNV